MQKNIIAVMLAALFFILLLILSVAAFSQPKIINKIEYIKTPIYHFLVNEEINFIINDRKDFFINKYGEYIGNREVAEVIILKALQLGIPVNKAFALAKAESRLNPKTINKNKYSIDYGLFQLNNRSFPNVDYFNIKENTKYGLSYFREKYYIHKSYEVALLAYNAGNIKDLGEMTIKHLSNYLVYEKEFNKFFTSILNGENDG